MAAVGRPKKVRLGPGGIKKTCSKCCETKTLSEMYLHDLKGQAGTFDYNLISIIGNDLCRFIERPIDMTPRRLKVIRFHIDAMKHIAEKKVTGDDHEHGLRIINTLHSMTQKVLQEE